MANTEKYVGVVQKVRSAPSRDGSWNEDHRTAQQQRNTEHQPQETSPVRDELPHAAPLYTPMARIKRDRTTGIRGL